MIADKPSFHLLPFISAKRLLANDAYDALKSADETKPSK